MRQALPLHHVADGHATAAAITRAALVVPLPVEGHVRGEPVVGEDEALLLQHRVHVLPQGRNFLVVGDVDEEDLGAE